MHMILILMNVSFVSLRFYRRNPRTFWVLMIILLLFLLYRAMVRLCVDMWLCYTSRIVNVNWLRRNVTAYLFGILIIGIQIQMMHLIKYLFYAIYLLGRSFYLAVDYNLGLKFAMVTLFTRFHRLWLWVDRGWNRNVDRMLCRWFKIRCVDSWKWLSHFF